MNNPLISVLIPSYNHEKYVQDTIKSIIEQSYENIELIIVDDGSKDSTWDKINEMRQMCESRFKRVRFETKENEGTVVTFNRLISLAHGEFVLIIASDDALFDKDALKIQAEFLIKNKKYVLVVGDNQFIDGNGKVCYWDKDSNVIYNENEAAYKTFGEALKAGRPDIDFNSCRFGEYSTFYRVNYIPNGYLIRKSALDKMGGFKKEAPLEDYYLHFQLSKYGKYKYIDKVLFSYRWHNLNTIKNTEKMEAFTNQTRDFEAENAYKNPRNKYSKIMINYLNYGYIYKQFGIPFIFQIKKYKNAEGKRTKILTVFGMRIKI